MPSIGFTGIAVVEKATVVKSRGVTPAKANLTCQLQGSAPPLIGQLAMSDGNASEVWQDAAITHAVRRHVTKTKGHLVSVTVADRRWKWSQSIVSGVYNTRLDDGTISPANKKSVQELFGLIFQALGDTVDASGAPANLYPAVTWIGQRCDRAMQQLLKLSGCDIVLDYQLNVARVVRRGSGAFLPANGQEIEPPLTLTNGPVPGNLLVAGLPVVVQSKIKLQEVGIDKDGTIKLVDQLTYKPSGGWGNEWPLDFAGVSDEADRALARQTVWRWFAIKEFAEGGLAIPQLPGIAISKPTQLLPLRERLLETDKDHNDVPRQNFPYLEGDFWYKADDGSTSDHQRYTGKFRILYDLGIVVTETPVFKFTSGKVEAPALYLTCAHHVRDPQTDGLVLYSRQRSLGGGSTTVTEQPPLLRSIIRLYSKTSPSSVQDNLADVNAEADAYLDAMQVQHAPTDPPGAMQYRGFVFPSLDGAIAQVKHVFGGGGAYTIVSRHCEDDAYSPSQRQREAAL